MENVNKEMEAVLLHKESPPSSSESWQSREDDSTEDEITEEQVPDEESSTRSALPSQTSEYRSIHEDATLITQLESSPESQTTAVSKPILRVALILLSIYLTFGVVTYTSIPNQFSGTKTNVIVDALYFSIVTLATVGYGDIAPSTTKSKVLTMVLVIIGFLSLEYLLNRVVTHLLDLQEKALIACVKTPLMVEEGRIKTKWKMCFAILALVLCVIVATLFLYRYEKLDLVDSVYLSVISVATVGYELFAEASRSWEDY